MREKWWEMTIRSGMVVCGHEPRWPRVVWCFLQYHHDEIFTTAIWIDMWVVSHVFIMSDHLSQYVWCGRPVWYWVQRLTTSASCSPGPVTGHRTCNTLCSRVWSSKTHVYSSFNKTGAGHLDISSWGRDLIGCIPGTLNWMATCIIIIIQLEFLDQYHSYVCICNNNVFFFYSSFK